MVLLSPHKSPYPGRSFFIPDVITHQRDPFPYEADIRSIVSLPPEYCYMAHQFIDEIKRAIETSLPASSAIVGKIIQAIHNQSTSAKDIAAIIEHDPPLTAKLLKVSNSAYYGSSSTITSLQRAVVVLGLDTLRELVTTISVINSLSAADDNSDIDRIGFWYHSVGTAKACQMITEITRIERSDVAYVVGLLHDIGKILLTLSFPEQYVKVIKLAEIKQTRIILAERRLLNTDHTMIGKILCNMWGLPEDISTAILYHHDPMEVPRGSQKLARIVELGDYMCRKAKIGNPGDDATPQPSRATLALLGPSDEKVKENFMKVFRALYESKQEIEEFFGTLDSDKNQAEKADAQA